MVINETRKYINKKAKDFGDLLTPKVYEDFYGSSIGDLLTADLDLGNFGSKIGAVLGSALSLPVIYKGLEIYSTNPEVFDKSVKEFTNMNSELYFGLGASVLMLASGVMGYLTGNSLYNTIKKGRIDADFRGNKK